MEKGVQKPGEAETLRDPLPTRIEIVMSIEAVVLVAALTFLAWDYIGKHPIPLEWFRFSHRTEQPENNR